MCYDKAWLVLKWLTCKYSLFIGNIARSEHRFSLQTFVNFNCEFRRYHFIKQVHGSEKSSVNWKHLSWKISKRETWRENFVIFRICFFFSLFCRLFFPLFGKIKYFFLVRKQFQLPEWKVIANSKTFAVHYMILKNGYL